MGQRSRGERRSLYSVIWMISGGVGIFVLTCVGWSTGFLGHWTGQLAEGAIRIYGQ